MSKTIRITYYGMDGEGPTVKAAKEDAGHKLAHLVAQTEEAPVIVAVEGVAALVAYTQQGWGHRLITGQSTDNTSGFFTGPQYVSGSYETKQEARLAALRHVLDIAWRFECDDAAWLDQMTASRTGCPLSHADARTLRTEMLERWAWQRRYRKAREAGRTDEDARNIASSLHHLATAS
jgi:hypothetical protein